jgi:hypothetical protein
MTLSDRERFILHTMSVMVVDTMVKKFKEDKHVMDDAIPLKVEELIDIMNDIGQGRCRSLSRLEISTLYEEIHEEMMLGVEIHKGNI